MPRVASQSRAEAFEAARLSNPIPKDTKRRRSSINRLCEDVRNCERQPPIKNHGTKRTVPEGDNNFTE